MNAEALKFKSLTRHRDCGLLLLRVGLGLCFIIIHGGPKLLAGPEMWAKIGGAMGNFGIHFAPTFWGFMASMAEFGGGLLVALGLFFRPALFFLIFNLLVAATLHLKGGDGWGMASHAIELGIVFLALVFIGPGKYSLDKE